MIRALMGLVLLATPTAHADDPTNHSGDRQMPLHASYYEEWNLAALQRRYAKAVADPVPWTGFWWPYRENGIADRTYDRFEMSPADKLDRAQGNGQWIFDWEQANHGWGRSALDWWGHCNGWATAAIMEPEPRRSKNVNGVTFEVRDRKAALAEYWLQQGADYIGTRVWDENDTSSYAFWDVVPAQYYLLLTNVLGRRRQSIIVDRYTGAEVWNQPVVAYEMEPIRPRDYLGTDPRYPDLHIVNVTSTIWWMSDDVGPNQVTQPFKWKESMFYVKRRLRFELWLDAAPKFNSRGELISSGDIILTRDGYGGRWKNGESYATLVESHPDFMWIPTSYASSTGYKNPRLNDAWVNAHLSESPARRGE
jgi:hypothetical protein